MDDYTTVSLAIIGTMLLVFIIIFIATLVIQGIPLYKMAKKANLNNAWLSFVPVGNMYIIMNLPTSEFNFFNLYRTKNRKEAFLFYIVAIFGASFVCGLLSVIPCIGFIFSLALCAFTLMISFCVYSDFFATYYADQTTVLVMSICSMLIPLAWIILLYVTMGKDRIDNNNFINFN